MIFFILVLNLVVVYSQQQLRRFDTIPEATYKDIESSVAEIADYSINSISAPSPWPTKNPNFFDKPTSNPADIPTAWPTRAPVTSAPTRTAWPTKNPNFFDKPSYNPTSSPSVLPTVAPSPIPTTAEPSSSPSNIPTNSPTSYPTNIPTNLPTQSPTTSPTISPTSAPTSAYYTQYPDRLRINFAVTLRTSHFYGDLYCLSIPTTSSFASTYYEASLHGTTVGFYIADLEIYFPDTKQYIGYDYFGYGTTQLAAWPTILNAYSATPLDTGKQAITLTPGFSKVCFANNCGATTTFCTASYNYINTFIGYIDLYGISVSS